MVPALVSDTAAVPGEATSSSNDERARGGILFDAVANLRNCAVIERRSRPGAVGHGPCGGAGRVGDRADVIEPAAPLSRPTVALMPSAFCEMPYDT